MAGGGSKHRIGWRTGPQDWNAAAALGSPVVLLLSGEGQSLLDARATEAAREAACAAIVAEVGGYSSFRGGPVR